MRLVRGKRLVKIDGGGRGRYCCAQAIACSDELKYSNQRKALMTIYKFRRKGGTDSFEVKRSANVCGIHFLPEEVNVSYGIGHKTLLPGVDPSILKFREKNLIKKRKLPAKRNAVIEESTESEFEDES